MSLATDFLDKLTEAERAYFIACTDIFHDSSYSVIGRPSFSNQLQNTVVINLERTITQTNFPSVTPGANWDVNIVSFPFLTTQNMRTAVDNGYAVQLPASGGSRALMGGVTCFASDTGAGVLIPNTAPVSLNANTFFYPEYTNTITDHMPRPFYEVLSIGLEVINSTPELYRGGNVVRYRVPTQGRKVSLNVGDPVVNSALPRSEFYAYPLPPTTEAYATQYPDSVIDKASNGSYQMHTLQDDVSDFYLAGNSRVFLANPSPSAAGPSSFNCYISDSTFDTTDNTDPPLIRGDFDIIGSYFTGLSPQTTLKIRSRAIVSLVPSSTNASLVSLAKVSPDPNPMLDYTIHQIQANMSPGIESSMNASGDWWRVVMRGLQKVAPIIGEAFGGKQGEVIGQGVGAAAGLIANAGQKNKKKPKAKSPPKIMAKKKPVVK